MSTVILLLVLQVPQSSGPEESTLLLSDQSDLEDALAEHEEMMALAENPIDLGREITFAELDRLLLIPEVTVEILRSIAEFIGAFGPPHDMEEMAAVELVDREALSALRPFVIFGDAQTPTSDGGMSYGRRRRRGAGRDPPAVILDASLKRPLETRAGFMRREDGYAGAPWAHRYRFEFRPSRHVTARILTDHDAGEAFLLEPGEHAFGPDFVSSSLEIQDVGPIRRLVLGDFVARFGHGLALWTGARRSGTTGGRLPAPRMAGVSAKAGTSEFGFLRGIAVRFSVSRSVMLDAFTSSIKHDGGNATGLHRSPSERSKRRSVSEQMHGAAVMYLGRSISLCLLAASVTSSNGRADTSSESRADTSSERAESSSENQVEGLATLGSTIRLRLRSFEASLEVGWRQRAPLSWLVSASFEPADWFEVRSLVRHYGPAAAVPHVAPLGAGSLSGGTAPGWLNAVTLSHGNWKLHLFRDYLVGSTFTATRARPELREVGGGNLHVRYRGWTGSAAFVRDVREVSSRAGDEGRAVRSLEREPRIRSRLRFTFEASGSVELRLALSVQKVGLRFGAGIFQEVRWRPSPALQLIAGVMAFGTDDSVPVYAFEPDVRLQYSWLRLDGAGSRAFVLVKLFPGRGFEVQLKYGQTAYENTREIGSGLDRIRTDRLRTVTISMRVKM